MIALVLLVAIGENVREAPPQPPPQAPQLTKLPELVEFHPAVYPPDRLERGETADVVCQVDIDEHGAVSAVTVEKSAAPDFDAAALEAIQQFRFSPAEVDGKPAAVRIRYVYHFVLEKKRVEKPKGETGIVRGEVSEAGTRRPIAGADVVDDTGALTATDAKGLYQLEAPIGERKLTISAPGFDERSFTVKVTAGATVEARRAWLHRTAVGDLQATIPGEKPQDAPTRRTLTHDELVNVPGSLNDPIRAVQNLPGMNRAPFLSGALLVRGSPPQDTGTYLDGHRIPLLYHFLGGPSVINEQLLDRIDFYPGGYGAYYGRNLVGAIDVGTRKGDQQGLHGQVALGLWEGVGFLEGPIGSKTQFAVAARRSDLDLWFTPLVKSQTSSTNGVLTILPIYWDYQARIDHKLEGGDDLGILLFGSDDKLSVVQSPGQRTLPLSVNTHIGFHRAVATYKHAVSDELTLSLSPALGWTKQSFDAQGAGPGPFATQQSADVTILTGEMRGEARWKARSWAELRLGIDLELDRATYSVDIQSQQQLRNLGILITQEDKFTRVQPAQLLGEYGEVQLTFGKLLLVPGLRAEEIHWMAHQRLAIDPRLWARYSLTPETSLKAYTGLYHQPPTGLQIDNDLGNPDLGLAWALQFGTGVEHRISDVWNVSAEVFYNRRGSLVVLVDPVAACPASNPSCTNPTAYNPRYLNNGIGRAFGLELLIRREITSKLYGWLAYTLSKSQILRNPGDPWRAFAYDQPHILTLVMGYRPTPRWELSSRFRYVSGNPTAPVLSATFDADAGSYVADRGVVGDSRSPAFLQLDARAQYTWTWDYWQLALYLDVQNVTNHVNEEFHLYDFRYRDQGSIQGIPIFPTLGLKGSF
jgi:TonB family protein